MSDGAPVRAAEDAPELPGVSVVIATRNSAWVLEPTLASIAAQDYPADRFEIILADNESTDGTREMAERYGARVVSVPGTPPQVCVQRNLGAQAAAFEYVYVLDHDMEFQPGLLRHFAAKVGQTGGAVDAWFVRERVMAASPLLRDIRTFERGFYDATPIDAVRIVKKDALLGVGGYDTNLSAGPADWDMDCLLLERGCRFDILDAHVIHHEENVTFRTYLRKKGGYSGLFHYYLEKWKDRNPALFASHVGRQVSPGYRLLGVYLENGKWRRVLRHPLLFAALFGLRVLVGVNYVLNRRAAA